MRRGSLIFHDVPDDGGAGSEEEGGEEGGEDGAEDPRVLRI